MYSKIDFFIYNARAIITVKYFKILATVQSEVSRDPRLIEEISSGVRRDPIDPTKWVSVTHMESMMEQYIAQQRKLNPAPKAGTKHPSKTVDVMMLGIGIVCMVVCLKM